MSFIDIETTATKVQEVFHTNVTEKYIHILDFQIVSIILSKKL